MCPISDSFFDVWFPTCHFYPSKCDMTRPPNFRKFMQTTEKCCNRNICGTFCKLGSLLKSNFDRTIRGSSCSFICVKLVIDVWFPTCHFYPSKCDITRPPNFRKILQTAEECCNRNICRTF